MKIILPPHKKISLKVEKPQELFGEICEIIRLITGGEMHPAGSKYNDCFAVAHPQVSNKPLRFFVLNPAKTEMVKIFEGIAIINPKILSKDKLSRIMFPEGCLSYPHRALKKIKRFNKIEVEYEVMDIKGRDFNVHTVRLNLEGLPAIVFQHELDHLNAKYIWDK